MEKKGRKKAKKGTNEKSLRSASQILKGVSVTKSAPADAKIFLKTKQQVLKSDGLYSDLSDAETSFRHKSSSDQSHSNTVTDLNVSDISQASDEAANITTTTAAPKRRKSRKKSTDSSEVDDETILCGACKVLLVKHARGKQSVLGCDGPCDGWFNTACVKVGKVEFSVLKADKTLDWYCPECKNLNNAQKRQNTKK